MTDVSEGFALEVVGGEDHGARMLVDARVRTIGRARDADLPLSDPAVSRRHVQVTAAEGGVQLAVCGNSAPFVVAGQAVRSLHAKSGDRITLGNTLIVVVGASRAVSLAPGAPGDGEEGSQTDVGTLLTGVAADVRAIAGVHKLIESLDAAADRAALEDALRAWAGVHAMVTRVVLVEKAPGAGVNLSTVTETRGESGGIVVTVPARTDEPTWIAFHCSASKPSESFRRMLAVAGRVFGSALARVQQQEVAHDDALAMRALSFGSARAFLGSSPQAQLVASMVTRLSASDVTVLLEGETGVGKTFVARLLHETSARAREPLRVINCAAIPENLVESELFGHERGAFTGAVATRAGAFELAGKGTLFLDEIGELSFANQAKLLRVLEERRFERVGGAESIDVRARMVFATNRDLEEMVAAKTFRSDLFFRVSVVRVKIPALRDRGEDLVLLAKQILSDVAQSAPRRISGFSPEALELIKGYAWPGNVRELRNAIEHAVALGDGALVGVGDFPASLAAARPAQPADLDLVRLPLDLASLERRGIEAALRETNGNRAKAAALLGINRTTLYVKLKEFGVT
jgi:DNA-binding NtrC family response regulator/pSer/pThr/pTyr-binding forkhead associated (FHA) protein